MATIRTALIVLPFLGQTASFVVSPLSRAREFQLRSAKESKDGEPDLFDYFDPLRSPHEYPNGISPEGGQSRSLSGRDHVSDDSNYDPLRLNVETPAAEDYMQQKGVRAEDSSVFDPLLSPHAYPNGVPSKVISNENMNARSKRVPLPDSSLHPSDWSEQIPAQHRDTATTPDFFDPTISPHAYTNGTPDKVRLSRVIRKKKVGVLLVDHGSRNKASNDRLHILADIFGETTSIKDVVVQAAHMELATPSIPEGLERLMDQGVDEIVCHPYFLSAEGRHVSEDIPAIVNAAIESLDIQIPVTTTEPVGSQTDIMIGAIQSLVVRHSTILREDEF
jgi:hypothetical protein